ncbi:MAG TPA: DUF2235 domain-containing protein [Candidatus Binatia bacterium]|nr:DUF2235 domain-containing protein [Candidatus Binatia bacterium]
MKRLVICCDGTWQRLYGDALTNVALTARSVATRDGQGNPQIVFYSEGVGASLSGLSLWQGMTGADLDDNLLEAWLFLNLNYEPGDQIYLFGFSRGAYTVRSLAGLLRKIGVLRRAHVDKARNALDIYRTREFGADSPETERFRTAHAIAWPRLAAPFTAPPYDLRIRYLGLWDTVGALGIPRLLPIQVGLNKGYEFHDTALSRSVQFARHAVAIDERRAAFAPTLWSNVDAFNPPGAAPRVLQMWFPGDHGGVGGGEARGLSNCALMWVLEGAERAGLALQREPGSVLSGCLAEIDPINAPINGLSRLGPIAMRWRQGITSVADVHETARLRWIGNSRYRPAPLSPFANEMAAALPEADAA